MITKYDSTRKIVVEYYGSPLLSHICIFLKTNTLNVSLYIDIFYWSSFPYCVMHTLIQIYFSTLYWSVIIFLISNVLEILRNVFLKIIWWIKKYPQNCFLIYYSKEWHSRLRFTSDKMRRIRCIWNKSLVVKTIWDIQGLKNWRNRNLSCFCISAHKLQLV